MRRARSDRVTEWPRQAWGRVKISYRSARSARIPCRDLQKKQAVTGTPTPAASVAIAASKFLKVMLRADTFESNLALRYSPFKFLSSKTVPRHVSTSDWQALAYIHWVGNVDSKVLIHEDSARSRSCGQGESLFCGRVQSRTKAAPTICLWPLSSSFQAQAFY